MKIIGTIRARHIYSDSRTEEFFKKNLIVDGGLETVAAGLAGDAVANPTHIAVGEGSTSASESDTDLVDEIERLEANVSRTGSVVELEASFGPGQGTGSWTEAGLFSNSTGGTMFSRIVFPERFKGENDTIQIDWTLDVNR